MEEDVAARTRPKGANREDGRAASQATFPLGGSCAARASFSGTHRRTQAFA